MTFSLKFDKLFILYPLPCKNQSIGTIVGGGYKKRLKKPPIYQIGSTEHENKVLNNIPEIMRQSVDFTCNEMTEIPAQETLFPFPQEQDSFNKGFPRKSISLRHYPRIH